MARLLFEKKDRAVWISHLDLMRVFQRSFKRAGLQLKHTQGFNPRPSVSIALPLSVGVESYCEILDFDLDGQQFANAEIIQRLNSALVSGVQVLDVYDGGKKIRDLSLLECRITLEYDHPVCEITSEAIQALFSQKEVIVPKKTKSGIQDQNIVEMIRSIAVSEVSGNCITLNVVLCCQNPALNPAQIPLAIDKFLPEHKPQRFRCARIEIYDNDMNVFR